MSEFLLSLPKEGLYYFDKIDTSKINITYTYKKLNGFQRFLRNVNLVLLRCHITFLNNSVCNFVYNKKINDAINNDTGLAILDYFTGRELLVKASKKKCKNFFLLIWNSISKERANKYKQSLNPKYIYSYSKEDAEKYEFNHFNDFYLIDYPHKNVPIKYDMFYLGSNKNRLELLKDFAKTIKDKLSFEFDVFVGESKDDYENESGITYFSKYMSFDEYIDKALAAKCLVDFNNHHNITFRTIEAMIFDKKYITNNAEIKKMDFYNENNILIVNENTSLNDITEFVNKKYVPVPREILNRYDIYHTYEMFKEKVNK